MLGTYPGPGVAIEAVVLQVIQLTFSARLEHVSHIHLIVPLSALPGLTFIEYWCGLKKNNFSVSIVILLNMLSSHNRRPWVSRCVASSKSTVKPLI